MSEENIVTIESILNDFGKIYFRQCKIIGEEIFQVRTAIECMSGDETDYKHLDELIQKGIQTHIVNDRT